MASVRRIGCRAHSQEMVAVFKCSPHHPGVGYQLILAITLALAILAVAVLYAAVRSP